MNTEMVLTDTLPQYRPAWPYVSQFVLGPEHARLNGWQRVAVSDDIKLTLHPDLPCVQTALNGKSLTLIGQLLDPRHPDAGNPELLRTLLSAWNSRQALIAATAGLGGRWIVIGTCGREAFLFHDALGLRQVFYTEPARAGALWASSQQGLFLQILPLEPDSQALDYMDTATFRQAAEYRWPGTASTFLGLKHLLPNHWLDLRTGEAARYWPAAPIEPLTPAAAVERLQLFLPGLLRAAANRFDLALSLTAGFDSRVMLAAARSIVERARLVSVRQGRMADGHADIDVPARLLGRLGLGHDVVRAASAMTPGFSFEFKRNVHLAHDRYGHDAEAILAHFGRRYAAVTGSGAEIGRCPFRNKLPHADRIRFDAGTLAWIEFGSTHPFLVSHLQEWLDDAGRQKWVKLLDLFEWEQDHGNWLAMVQLEFDVAWRDVITPYNCREVLSTLLGVEERYRRQRDGQLWRQYIAAAWPELLCEPINPHRASGRWRQAVADLKAVRRHWMFSRRHNGERGVTR